MIRLTDSVGPGGANRSHDVAVVQAILSQVTAARPGGGEKLWTRGIDGNASPALERAVQHLFEREQVRNGRRIEKFGPELAALERVLPSGWRQVTGIEGTIAVACTVGGQSEIERAARTLRDRTLLPRQAAEALAGLARDLHRTVGLTVRADGHGLDAQGRLVQKLALLDTRWVSRDGRLETRAPLGQGRRIVEALHRVRPGSAIDWCGEALPTHFAGPHPLQALSSGSLPSDGAFDGATLAVRTREAVVPDPRNLRVDPHRLIRLKIPATGDPVADRLIAAATQGLGITERDR